MTGILQALPFVTMVFLAMLGAKALDTKLSACAARAGFIEVAAVSAPTRALRGGSGSTLSRWRPTHTVPGPITERMDARGVWGSISTARPAHIATAVGFFLRQNSKTESLRRCDPQNRPH